MLQYTSPVGLLSVVESISIVWGDVTISGLDAWVQRDDLTKLTRITQAAGIQGDMLIGGRLLDVGKWCLQPGESLWTQTASGTVDFFCSGYALELP